LIIGKNWFILWIPGSGNLSIDRHVVKFFFHSKFFLSLIALHCFQPSFFIIEQRLGVSGGNRRFPGLTLSDKPMPLIYNGVTVS